MGQADSKDAEEVAEAVMTTAVEGTDPIRAGEAGRRDVVVFFLLFAFLILDGRIHRYIL